MKKIARITIVALCMILLFSAAASSISGCKKDVPKELSVYV